MEARDRQTDLFTNLKSAIGLQWTHTHTQILVDTCVPTTTTTTTYSQEIDGWRSQRIARWQQDTAMVDATLKVGITLASNRKVPFEQIVLSIRIDERLEIVRALYVTIVHTSVGAAA
jgi:hypothetical protein